MCDAILRAEVPFSEIPRQSRLYLSYLEGSGQALSFYGQAPSIEAITRLSRDGLPSSGFQRAEITAILSRQNERYGADGHCRENIRLLAMPDCAAIVTGQQAGVFGGPLYTIYKAFTAIRLAEELRDRGVPAVPIFWMDTDDHDLAEVARITVLEDGSELRRQDLRLLLFGEAGETARPVGSIALPQSVLNAIETYLASLSDKPWRDWIRSRLESAYSPGTTLGEAFGRLMSGIFGSRGLILFDPRDNDAKRLVSPLFRKALLNADDIHRSLSTRSDELQAAGFHAQVAIQEDASFLFLTTEQGERRALFRDDGGFRLKGTGIRFTLADLLALAEREPERFSPNVLLRPAVQDTLFPTVCYVAGPGEIAYYAQADTLYRLAGRPMPVIWPRNSFTLLDTELAEVMASAGLGLTDCFRGTDSIFDALLQASGLGGATALLAGMKHELAEAFDQIRPAVTGAEATLGIALDTAGKKIFHQLDGLRAKFVHMEAARHGKLRGQAKWIINSCCPAGVLQEREFGLWPFIARCGPGLLDAVYSYTQTDHFTHRVLSLRKRGGP